jgi:retron-type reverse transcriptase
MAFTSLNHYLDAEWMRYAFECTRKDGAVGVDGQTAEGYALNLEHNLAELLDQLKSGRYRAPPVRRHYIEKPGGGQRALGIATVTSYCTSFSKLTHIGVFTHFL